MSDNGDVKVTLVNDDEVEVECVLPLAHRFTLRSQPVRPADAERPFDLLPQRAASTWQGRTIDEVIAFLNELLALDADAVTAWVETRVGCNEALAAHPTLQVAGKELKEPGERADGSMDLGLPFRFGLLGVLNGIFGADGEGWGFIAAQYNDGEDYARNPRIARFLRTPERHQLQTEEQRQL